MNHWQLFLFHCSGKRSEGLPVQESKIFFRFFYASKIKELKTMHGIWTLLFFKINIMSGFMNHYILFFVLKPNTKEK